MSLTYRVWDWLWAGSRELTRKTFLAKETQKWVTVSDFSMKFDIVTKLRHCHPAGEALLHPPLSPLVKAPLKEPPMRMSPSCRSSRDKSLTGMGWRYTWKQLLSFRVTGRVRTKSSEKRNTCSLCSVTSKKENRSHSLQLAFRYSWWFRGSKSQFLPSHSCCAAHHDTAESYSCLWEDPSAYRPDIPICLYNTGIRTLLFWC